MVAEEGGRRAQAAAETGTRMVRLGGSLDESQGADRSAKQSLSLHCSQSSWTCQKRVLTRPKSRPSVTVEGEQEASPDRVGWSSHWKSTSVTAAGAVREVSEAGEVWA